MLNGFSVLASTALQTRPVMPVMSPVVTVIYVGVLLITLVATWMIFAKADKPGWLCIIPIANVIVLLSIAGKPWWWIILLLIPLLNIIILILVYIDLARAFGQGVLFGIGLLLLPPIFIWILGFGSAEYVGV